MSLRSWLQKQLAKIEDTPENATVTDENAVWFEVNKFFEPAWHDAMGKKPNAKQRMENRAYCLEKGEKKWGWKVRKVENPYDENSYFVEIHEDSVESYQEYLGGMIVGEGGEISPNSILRRCSEESIDGVDGGEQRRKQKLQAIFAALSQYAEAEGNEDFDKQFADQLEGAPEAPKYQEEEEGDDDDI